MSKDKPHVVIVGGGFGGLTAAQNLAGAPVRVTLVDRTNHHLFQPLLYQVAIAGLSPADIASPIRAILRGQKNARVLLGEVTGFDLARKEVLLGEESLKFDYLVLACGAETNYFGHDEWARNAPGLKNLDDAIEIRKRVLLAFEAAERETDPQKRRRLLTFVAIGGGATGVEIAGAIAELARHTLVRDFRHIDPSEARVMLVEAGPRVLAAFDESLSEKAIRQMKDLGIEVRTSTMVTGVSSEGVTLGQEFVPAANVIWGAGVRANPLAKALGAPTDRAGRVITEPDCSIPGHPDVFAIGDMACYAHHEGGKPLPGVSMVAMQQARFVARSIVLTMRGAARGKFEFFDKGSMATIGRSRAIAEVGKLKLSGFMAWLAWVAVHLFYLIGYRNRFVVMFNWLISYVTYGRGARLITGHHPDPWTRRVTLPGGAETASAASVTTAGADAPRVSEERAAATTSAA